MPYCCDCPVFCRRPYSVVWAPVQLDPLTDRLRFVLRAVVSCHVRPSPFAACNILLGFCSWARLSCSVCRPCVLTVELCACGGKRRTWLRTPYIEQISISKKVPGRGSLPWFACCLDGWFHQIQDQMMQRCKPCCGRRPRQSECSHGCACCFRICAFLFIKADMRNAAGVAEETARLNEKTAAALAAGKALRCDLLLHFR